MKNVLGNSITVSLFGESHGAQIGVMIDGIAPGIDVDLEFMRKQLDLRKPHGKNRPGSPPDSVRGQRGLC